MPPMTAVPPSLTTSRVLASLVEIGALVAPATMRLVTGSFLEMLMSMMIVPSAVTWGVTSRRSVALMNWVVTVLLAMVWIGSWMPLWMYACWLLSVATFGADRMLSRPSCSAA